MNHSQAFGRTPLTNISPKKTWEGALAGLAGCIATSVVLSKIFCWPSSLLRLLFSSFRVLHTKIKSKLALSVRNKRYSPSFFGSRSPCLQ